MIRAHVGHYASPSLLLFVVPLLIAALWLAGFYLLGRRGREERHQPVRGRPVGNGKRR